MPAHCCLPPLTDAQEGAPAGTKTSATYLADSGELKGWAGGCLLLLHPLHKPLPAPVTPAQAAAADSALCVVLRCAVLFPALQPRRGAA
jgi:hypothetical protein